MESGHVVNDLIDQGSEVALYNHLHKFPLHLPYMFRAATIKKLIMSKYTNILNMLAGSQYPFENANENFRDALIYGQNEFAKLLLTNDKLDFERDVDGMPLLDIAIHFSKDVSIVEKLIESDDVKVSSKSISMMIVKFPKDIDRLFEQIGFLPLANAILEIQSSAFTFTVLAFTERLTIEKRMELLLKMVRELSLLPESLDAIVCIRLFLEYPKFVIDYRFFNAVMQNKHLIKPYLIEYLALEERIINVGGMGLIVWHTTNKK